VRSAYYHEMGAFRYKDKTGLGPILFSTYCRFRIPLTYPDKVSVAGRIDDSDIGEDRFTMRYAVLSHQHGKIAAEGDGVVVYVDYKTGKKVPIPDPMRQAIADIERRRGGGHVGR
jgi:acyl-CoA thioester hydrolase